MKVMLLGTGATLPQYNRNASGLIVQINEDFLLFDCGNGVLRQLEKGQIDLNASEYHAEKSRYRQDIRAFNNQEKTRNLVFRDISLSH